MADIGRIKDNLVGMINKNAPQQDLDMYLSTEGVTLEDIRQHEKSLKQPTGQPNMFVEHVTNFPSDFKQVLGNIFNTFRHPLKTAEGLSELLGGGIEKVLGSARTPEEQARNTQVFDTVTQMFSDNYGSFEKAEQTFRKKPAQFWQDVSVVFGGVSSVATKTGGAVSKLGKAGQVLGSKLESVGKLSGAVSTAVEPLKATTKAIGGVASMRKPVNSMVKSILKIPHKKSLQRIDELAQAFVDKDLWITRRSLARLSKSERRTRNTINTIIDKKTKEGLLVDTNEIVKSLDDLTSDYAKQGLEAVDLKIIANMKSKFIELHGQKLTPRQLQDIKTGYTRHFKSDVMGEFGQVRRKVREKYRERTKSAIEQLDPKLKGLNWKDGIDIELIEAVDKAIKRHEDSATVGTKGLVVGGATGGIVGAGTGSVSSGIKYGLTAFAIEKIIGNPNVQLKIAKKLHDINKSLAKTGQLYPLEQFGFQAGKIQEEANNGN